jgi:iron complex outermembrane receptor protein
MSTYLLTKPSSLSALAAVLASACAATASDTLQTLPDVEVSARPAREELQPRSLANPYRTEKSAEAGTETFNREDIQALEPKDVFDLLDKAVGLNVTYQGRKSPFFVDQRGGGNLTYILDGAILPTSSNRILQSIPLEAIEQIQVVRGSSSLVLGPTIPVGSSASGSGVNTGFVIIRTRRPAKTEATATSYWEQALSQKYADGQSVYFGTVLGDSAGVSGHVAGMVSRSDVPSKATWFDGRSSGAVMAAGGIKWKGFSLDLMGYGDTAYFEMQRGLTLADTLDNSKWYYQPLVTTVLSANGSMVWNPAQVTIFSGYWTKYEQTEIDASFANATTATKQFAERTEGGSLRHNARFANTLLQAGGQYVQSSGFGPNTSNSYNNWKTSVLGWSASAEQGLLDNSVSLDAGYRQDIKHVDRSATAATKISADTNVDLAPARVITAGAGWDPGFLKVSARYFGGWEGTNGDFDLVTKSGAALHAEKQTRLETSLEGTLFPWARPMATWFLVYIDNQKTATTDTYTVDAATYYYYTESNSRRQGLEFQLNGSLGALVNYGLTWTHLLVNETETSGVTTDNITVAYPENIYTARIGAAWKGWRANISGKNVDPWFTSTSSMGTATNVKLGDYIRYDANIAKDLSFAGHWATAEIYGRNLTNDRYSTRYTTGYYRDRGLTLGTKLSVGL